MERLTQWIDESLAIPRVDLRRCGHDRCTTQLARYEDTGLTPELAQELKARDTTEGVLLNTNGFGVCPHCDREFNSELVEEYEIEYCPWCGQKIAFVS